MDFKQFIKENKCDISSVSLQVQMKEKIMMRIAIVECNKLKVKERGLCWKALTNYFDEINEKRLNISLKMMAKNVNSFIKIELVDLSKT